MNETILIIEDEPQMLRLLGLTLEREGYRIAAAQTAVATRAQLQKTTPDLIILDVMLPDMSGLALCQELRQQPATAAIPILMLSALGQVSDKVAGLKAGADEYVVKPIDSIELVARVGSLLERARRMRGEIGAEQGKVISFLGSKGGLGTTTALVSIGAALSMAGKRVIVAELRPELGHLQTLLGLGSGDGTQGLFALAPQAISAKSVSGWIVTHNSGLQVLPAPTGIRPDLAITTEQAQAIVAALSLSAEIVLLDLPPFTRIESETALGLSDRVLLTLEPTRLGLESAAAMAAYGKAHARPAAELRLLIINRAPLTTPIAVRQIEERLGWKALGAIPPAPDEAARAQLLGSPVVHAVPDSSLSQASKELARAIA
jgi:DNA-binding response OmpR family regulator